MANYAYNTIEFIAKEENLLDLEFLHSNIMTAYLDKNIHHNCNTIFGEISRQFETQEYKFDGRDHISWMFDEISYDSMHKFYSFTVDFESAWRPLLGRVQIWVNSINPNTWTVGIAEEPGFEIYENTDTLGIYFGTRYTYYDDRKEIQIYQDYLEDLVDNLKSSFPESKDKLDAIEAHTLEDIQSVMNEVLSEDDAITIYMYEEEASDTFDN